MRTSQWPNGRFVNSHFFRYAAIGLTGVGIDFILYTLLVGLGVNPLLSTVISISVAILNNFFLNIKFNFRVSTKIVRRLVLFYIVGLLGLLLSVGLIYLFNSIFGFDAVIAKVLTVVPVVVLQYWLNKNVSLTENFSSIPREKIGLVLVATLVLGMFAFGAVETSSQDESDNILGSHIVAQGGVIYRDYFSHHMPLLYYIGAPVAALTGDNILEYKVIFGLVMAVWLMLIAREVRSLLGTRASMGFAILVALAQIPMGYNGYLAEDFVAFAACHAGVMLLLAYQRRDALNLRRVILLSVLSCVPLLASASYAPLSIVLFLMSLLVVADSQHSTWRNIRRITVATLGFCLPPLALAAHLIWNSSFTEFIQQAFQFNTKYYSYFESDAPHGLIDSGLQVISGSLTGLSRALVGSGDFLTYPITTLFAAATLLSLWALYRSYSKVVAIAAAVLLLVASAREGFYAIFTIPPFPELPTRSGIALYFMALILFLIVMSNSRLIEAKEGEIKFIRWVTAATLVIIGVFSAAQTSEMYRTFLNGKQIVATERSSHNLANTMNTLIHDDEYYWLGPWDFQSQIFINKMNASSYRFYLPWHMICEQCNSEMIRDFSTRRPAIVYFNESAYTYWTSSQGINPNIPPLYNYIRANYVSAQDKRLKDYYFLKSKKMDLTQRLEEQGYRL